MKYIHVLYKQDLCKVNKKNQNLSFAKHILTDSKLFEYVFFKKCEIARKIFAKSNIDAAFILC